MGHFVTGLIARHAVLRAFAASKALPAPVPLTEILSLLPLGPDELDRLMPDEQREYYAGFNYLSTRLASVFKRVSAQATLLYFETEYFGGMGNQGAAVFRDGELVFGPQAAELGPINNALAVLGVRRVPPAADEFETVGLHRHRSVDAWAGRAGDD